MSLFEGIKNIAKSGLSFYRNNKLASTLVSTAALAYLVYRMNRNNNRDNLSDLEPLNDAGARIQLPPAADHKIPVLYGTAYFGGAITDAVMTNNNKTMTFAITLSEKTGTKLSDSLDSNYTFKDVYYNDQRVVFKTDGYTLDYTVDRNGQFDRSASGLIKIYCYAGGSDQPSIPDGYTNASYPTADQIMPNWQASTHTMADTIFAIVEVNYNREKNVTSLGNLQFEIENDMRLPGDVIYDYMSSARYGAGLNVATLDSNSFDDLNTFSASSVNYNDAGTGIQTLTNRYQINGLISTEKNVMENIELIASSAGSWLRYDPGNENSNWGVVINKSDSSVANFDDSNIIGTLNVSGTGLKELYNKVKVEFPNRDIRDVADYVNIEINSADRNVNEEDNTFNLRYDIVNEPVQAQLLGLIELKQSRLNLVVEFAADYSYINLKAGELITLTNSRFGFTNKIFRIITVSEQDTDGLTVKITALEYDANVYSIADLSRYVRTDENGIISIGSIGVPGTPQVTKIERDSRPRIEVDSTAPTGLVEGMEFWRSTDVNLADENRSYQLIATVNPANGGVFTSGTTVELDYDALTQSDFVIKTRGINSTTVGPFSAVSGLIDFTPKQETDSIGPDTGLTDSTGNLLGALTLIEVLLKLHELFGSGDGQKSIFERIFEIFRGETGRDIVEETKAGTFGGGGITVQDEGTEIVAGASILNFVGDNVSASVDGGKATITVTGGSSSSGSGGSGAQVINNPQLNDTIVYNGRDWVAVPSCCDPINWPSGYAPSSTSYSVECKLDIGQRFPPDRNDEQDPNTEPQASSDLAPVTGSYFVRMTGKSIKGNLSAGSGNCKLYKSDGTLVQTLTAAQVTIDKNTIELPFSTRDYKTDYYITMDAGFVTYCGCPSKAITAGTRTGSWNFNTPAQNVSAPAYSISGALSTASRVAPAITSVTPSGLSCNTPPNLRITFDRAVTVGSGSIEIKKVSDDSTVHTLSAASGTTAVTYSDVPYTYTGTPLNGSGAVLNITITPSVYGDPSTPALYSVTLVNGGSNYFADDGNETAKEFLTVSGSNLGGGADCVVSIMNVDASGTITRVKITSGTSGARDSMVDFGTISNLVAGEEYYFTLPSGAVTQRTDDCNETQPNAVVNKNTDYYFEIYPALDLDSPAFTVDSDPPIASDPNHLQVNPQSNIGIIFNRSISFASSGTVTLYKVGAGSVQVFDVAQTYSGNQVSELMWIDGTTLYINPTTDMDLGGTYYVLLSSGVVQDGCGTTYGGLTNVNTIRFTVDAGPVASAPVFGGNNVFNETQAYVDFDRTVEKGTGSIEVVDTATNTVVKTIPASSDAVYIEEV
jgi:hypothetical protein